MSERACAFERRNTISPVRRHVDGRVMVALAAFQLLATVQLGRAVCAGCQPGGAQSVLPAAVALQLLLLTEWVPVVHSYFATSAPCYAAAVIIALSPPEAVRGAVISAARAASPLVRRAADITAPMDAAADGVRHVLANGMAPRAPTPMERTTCDLLAAAAAAAREKDGGEARPPPDYAASAGLTTTRSRALSAK